MMGNLGRALMATTTVAALNAAAMAGLLCPTGMAVAADKPAIAVSVADQKSLFYIAAVDGMREAAKQAGYELRIASASNNSRQQINQIQNLLVQQPGALIFIPQDATSAEAGVRSANQAGVPVIAVDERPEGGTAKLSTYIATDSVKAARDVCSWMFDQIGDKGNIAILTGVLGATAQLQRSQGCQEALAQHPDVHVVAQQTANWDETEAYKAAQNILTAHGDIKGVFGESDAMAMGAAKAAKQEGRSGLVVVGIDGFPTMFKAIAAGLTQATMAQRPYEMGQTAVRNAIALMNKTGSDIPATQYVDAQLVDGKTVGQFQATQFYGPRVGAQ